MDLKMAHVLLKVYPYRCGMCNTGKMTYPKTVLDHMNGKRHRILCARNNIDACCTSSDGSSCLTNELKAYLLSTNVSMKTESTVAPAITCDPLDISSARLSSILAPSQLSGLCDHVEDLARTLNVGEVTSLLAEHGFKETAWRHLEDNTTRVKALCVHIMRTNNLALFQSLNHYFEKRRQDYEEICRFFNNSSSNGPKAAELSKNGHESSAEKEVAVLHAKMQQMSSELEHYRQLQRNAVNMWGLSHEEKSVAHSRKETTPQDEASYLTCLKHVGHYAELILNSTGEKVTNPTSWLPLWPSPEGTYPTVDWGSLDDKLGTMAKLWKDIVTHSGAKKSPQEMFHNRKLTVPQLRLAPSVCRGTRLGALNLSLERKDSSLTLLCLRVSDINPQSCSLHVKARLLLPTSSGKYQELRRDNSLVKVEAGRECELQRFTNVSWNLIDSQRLPQLSLTLLPVDPVDAKWGWCGMPPMRADDAGVYPIVDWSSLGGDSDWFHIWKQNIAKEDNATSVTTSNSLCVPPMYLPGPSHQVIIMYLTRRQPNYMALFTFYHKDMRGKKLLITNTFQVHVELKLRLRNCIQTERRLKASQKVSINSEDPKVNGVCMIVNDWDMLDPEVLPSLSITITDVK